MENNNSMYNEEMAGYIWQILKTDLPVVMSWGLIPET